MTKHMTDLAAPLDFSPMPSGLIPALSIAAFSATPATHDALTAAQSNRRMARVRMTVSDGGIEAAIAAFAEMASPQVLILEHTGDQSGLLAQLDALAEVCEAGTRVILIGAENDIALYRELMRKGVSEYLPAPVSALQLVRCLSDLTAQPGAVRRGQVHAFVGACGGAGSSTVALNTAWLIGRAKKSPVSLIDLDLDFGTAGLSLALDGARGLAEALQAGPRLDPQFLDGLLHRIDDNLRVLPAPETSDVADPTPETVDHLIDLAREAAAQVVLDLPAPRSAVARRALANADHVVITATPDLAGLRNARKVLDLVRSLRPGESDPLVVLNKVGIARRPEITAKDFAAALGVPLVATLAFDPKTVASAANAGKVLAAEGRGKSMANALRGLTEALVGTPVKARSGLGERLTRLLRRS